jgi:hypothetical protein
VTIHHNLTAFAALELARLAMLLVDRLSQPLLDKFLLKSVHYFSFVLVVTSHILSFIMAGCWQKCVRASASGAMAFFH